ncbi:MAG: hypothetical protein P0Y65_00520 [Candidatus Devosia phytovorans]|uniref:Uncharacterized protein n=1 Tax=Candidatus Devosia phytovorans TaxID=3121372 RepID=A0AAJ5VWM0_9HYPH|nr:hypothetical protein [Devosia sp.]WEK04773.1 MAG: hypothetical protein P0Y65_00520 [Devosia sp.]
MGGRDDDGLGEEAQRGFANATDSVGAYTDMQAIVLMGYRYRCVLTGAQFGKQVLHLHPDLDVVAIQPLDQGGQLTIGNFLPMLSSLSGPFGDGLITIDDDYRIVVPHPDLLGRQLVDVLRHGLDLPGEELFKPGTGFLAYHRRYALGR